MTIPVDQRGQIIKNSKIIEMKEESIYFHQSNDR